MRNFLSLAILAIGLASSASAIPHKGYVSVEEAKLVKTESELPLAVENVHSLESSNPARVLAKILVYLSIPDYVGLFEYLGTLPETETLLDWLEMHYLNVFLRVCWIFDACKEHDLILDPETLQKILRYIADEDWEGLAEFVRTIDNYELLLEWIRTNFPTAWPNICGYFDKCTLLLDPPYAFARNL